MTQLDDIQAALEVVTTPQQQPLLHFWRTNWPEFSSFTDQEHVEHFLGVSRILDPMLAAVVADRLDGGLPAIVDGGFILPELATRAEFGGQPQRRPSAGAVRSGARRGSDCDQRRQSRGS